MKASETKASDVPQELAALAATLEDAIDFSDIPPAAPQDWHGAAVRGKFYRPAQKQLTVQIDADVLE